MITIQDNNYQGKVCSLHDTADLISIGNKPIRQLCDENENLLVFPLSIDYTDDRIGDSTIVDIYAEDGNSVRIKSGNIMGFVGRTRQTLWSAVQMLTQKLCCQTIHDCPKVLPLHYESE